MPDARAGLASSLISAPEKIAFSAAANADLQALLHEPRVAFPAFHLLARRRLWTQLSLSLLSCAQPFARSIFTTQHSLRLILHVYTLASNDYCLFRILHSGPGLHDASCFLVEPRAFSLTHSFDVAPYLCFAYKKILWLWPARVPGWSHFPLLRVCRGLAAFHDLTIPTRQILLFDISCTTRLFGRMIPTTFRRDCSLPTFRNCYGRPWIS